MDARWGWPLVALALAVGWWQWGWRGLVLALTLVVFWMLLQFSRSLRVMGHAAKAPVGHVANAVMFHSRLKPGLPLLQILPLTGSLGQRVAEDPETWRWADDAGDSVTLVLKDGRLAHWELQRAAEAPPTGGAA